MVIEWLKIKVAPEMREQYIQKDAEIWTAFLSEYPGFLGKEVWINPDNSTEVILVIRWASREAWKSVPSDRLAAIEQQFAQQLAGSYPIIEAGEYQVRKFPQS
ncbi:MULTISPECIES: TIGR03792 family protein [Trichocoleus]|uniref:TIGR03792 family protein n=1 Tax=Trichocoleus desertorum GB2-A4 TaxID=2933944 RepID=A0ABV0J5W9_9CYAN|nr:MULTISPECIES: TIGR03792 family protein [unclassified Trichocoleus]MBD1863289.1 TIGR03792 family protein [Trichocoleus sp. FACHB-46]MBD2123662.1 TIGR03792 family protein [Trichocoleus sp. FACHB-262]